jgi:nucleoside-diphosphate-sugar epimerase
MGTVHVLEAATYAGVEKVVFASSVSANGFTFPKREMLPRYLPLDEEHPCEPQDAYGLSKVVGELTCKQYSDAYGLHTICLRLGNNWYLDREGADAVVRSKRGSVRFASVEELWAAFRQRQDDPEGGYPPGPSVFWDGVDARDTAMAFRLALENDDVVHDVFMVLSGETYSTTPTPELIARYFAGIPLKTPLEGHASLVSHEKAARVLGYRPVHRWRESEFGAWREGRHDPV